MIAANPAFSTFNQNRGFRAWAKALGYVTRRQPDELQGEGDVWGVPLNRKRGWLWDAGPNIGVHMQGAAVWRNEALPALIALPGFRLQSHAADAVLGWVTREAWTEAHAAILGPRRFRNLGASEGAEREGLNAPRLPRGFAVRPSAPSAGA